MSRFPSLCIPHARSARIPGPGIPVNLLLTLFLALLLVSAPAAAADGMDEVVFETVPESRSDVEAYWTEERLREAQPMPMPTVGAADATLSRKAQASGAAVGFLAPAQHPGDRSAQLGPLDPAADATLAPKWGDAPWVYGRYRLFPNLVSMYTTYPYRAVGQLFFTIPGVGNFVCSGSVVTAQNRSTVWTAGHCVYSPPPGTGGYVGTHTNFLFIPARFEASAPLGTWTAIASGTTVGWQFGLLEYDHGVLVMNRGGLGNNHIATDTGALGFQTGIKPFQHFHAIGYPVAPRDLATTQPGLQFDGVHQEICTAAWAGSDLPTGGPGDPPTLGIGCDQTGGTSGGPWIVNFSGFVHAQNNLVNSHSSYRYTGPNPPANLRLYGPYFGSAALNLWSFAQQYPVP